LDLFDLVVDLITGQIVQALAVIARNVHVELSDAIFLHNGGHDLADGRANSTLIRLS